VSRLTSQHPPCPGRGPVSNASGWGGAVTAVTDGSATAELDDDELIEAVMGRLDQTSRFSVPLRTLLSMMP